MWQPLFRSDELAPGAIVAAVVPRASGVDGDLDGFGDDGEIVVWRTRDGDACAVARQCPHLDWDLLDATVQGRELVCAGHGWSITGDGRVFKRNEYGREDAKGTTNRVTLRELDGRIEAQTA